MNSPELGKMPRPEPAGEPGASAVGDSADGPAVILPSDFERLRELLLGNERRELDAAHARIAALEQSQRDLPQRLPEAAIQALRGEGLNPRVAEAFAEPVALALGAAVQRNRQNLIDTLFPIIGPMIRKAIAEALRNLVTDLNGAVESSFSPRGIGWRIEAWRAGVPYAQVVLKHRLAYQIDHVFLIDHASGLVLQHESAPELPPLDADAIAGMLTALGDFVGDSVGQGKSDTLESMRVGEHLVWVFEGPRANLACFMRGVPPAELRALLEQRLEEIHARVAGSPQQADLRSPANAEAWHALLEPASLLRGVDAQKQSSPKASSRLPLVLVLSLGLLTLGWLVVSRYRWNSRIESVHAQLLAHPGFVLTGLSSRAWRSLDVHGLLDPDAQPLDGVFAGADIGAIKPTLDLDGYLSSSDAIVERRALRLLAPPDGVRVTVKSGALTLAGNASDAWIAHASERAAWIAGVTRVDSTVSANVDPALVARAALDRLLAQSNNARIPFVQDAQLAPGADVAVDALAGNLQQALALAKGANVELDIVAIGNNDDSGTHEANARVRAQRAQWLALALSARGIADVRIGSSPESAAIDASAVRSASVHAVVRSREP
ncbi:MAG: hypothetical protein ABIQ70_13695 [Dokdonella sp.]